MNTILIKKFEKNDINFKINLINNSENNKYLHYELPLVLDKTEQWFESIKNLENRFDVVIFSNEEKVGIIGLLNIEQDYAEFYITMSVRGKGIAEEATKQLLRFAKEDLKLNKIYLYTEKENLRAQSFFKKVGFLRKDVVDSNEFKMLENRFYFELEL